MDTVTGFVFQWKVLNFIIFVKEMVHFILELRVFATEEVGFPTYFILSNPQDRPCLSYTWFCHLCCDYKVITMPSEALLALPLWDQISRYWDLEPLHIECANNISKQILHFNMESVHDVSRQRETVNQAWAEDGMRTSWLPVPVPVSPSALSLSTNILATWALNLTYKNFYQENVKCRGVYRASPLRLALKRKECDVILIPETIS